MNMAFRSFLLLLSALPLGLAPAGAQTPGGQATAPPSSADGLADDVAERTEEALALAGVVQPMEMVMQGELAQFDRDYLPTLRVTPSYAKIEDRYPGFLEAYWVALRPHAIKMLERRHPVMLAALAKFYADHMTLAELRATRAFFSGRTGQKMIRVGHTSFDLRAIIADRARAPGASVTPESYLAGVDSAVSALDQAMTEEEDREYAAFMRTDAGRKMTAMAPELKSFNLAWMSGHDPDFVAVANEVALEVIERLRASRTKRR
jgi:hypothetical protein